MNPLITTITPWVRQFNTGKSLDLSDEQIQSAIHSTLGFYHGLLLTHGEANLKAYLGVQQQVLAGLIEDSPEGNLRQELIGLWEDLHRYFRDWLTTDTVLPKVVLVLERQRNTVAWSPLKRQFRRGRVDAGLIVLLEQLFQFRHLPDRELVPVRKVRYTRFLLPQLRQLAEEYRGQGAMEDALVGTLFLHNMNAIEFFCWYRDRLLSGIPDELPLMERLRVFRRLLARHASVQQRTDRCLIGGLPGIHRQVEAFLTGQVQFWEGVLAMTKLLKEHGFLPVHVESILSVAQLALLFRIFCECGIFTIENPKDFFRFIADHFGSKKKDSFRWETLRTDFYVFPTMGDLETVRDMLKGMARHIETGYGVTVA